MAKNLKLMSGLAMVLVSATPVFAQDMTLDKILAGGQMPLSVVAKDLTSDYRRLVVNDPSGIASLQNMMIGAQTGVDMGLYFSKGETVTAGNETYLIAYRPQFKVDLAALNGHGHGNDAPVQPRKLRPNMVLSLSLLNLRTNARLDDIRAFDSKVDMESPQESSEASARNLTALGQGMMTYLRGRGQGVMPVIGSTVTAATRRTFYPFVHDQNLWVQPATEEPYLPNPRVSRVNVNLVANRKYVPAFYEGTPGSDGMRGVVFLDGHVERVTAQRWTRFQAVKVIARPGAKNVYSASDATTVVVVDEEGDPFADQ